MKALLEFLEPILLPVLTSLAARKLLVDAFRELALASDNEVDDALVDALSRALRVEE